MIMREGGGGPIDVGTVELGAGIRISQSSYPLHVLVVCEQTKNNNEDPQTEEAAKKTWEIADRRRSR
jgi:hypothetical protein